MASTRLEHPSHQAGTDGLGNDEWGAPRRDAPCARPLITESLLAHFCPERMLGYEAGDLGALPGAGPAPFAEVNAGIDARNLRLGHCLGESLEAAGDQLGSAGTPGGRAREPPARETIARTGPWSVPKNWRSISADAPASVGRPQQPSPISGWLGSSSSRHPARSVRCRSPRIRGAPHGCWHRRAVSLRCILRIGSAREVEDLSGLDLELLVVTEHERLMYASPANDGVTTSGNSGFGVGW